jgi:hypothetical protein
MLMAVVVNDKGCVGAGFFKLARELHLLDTRDSEADARFLERTRRYLAKVWSWRKRK